ncbi:MAG: error-prone DNA polymerase [Jatrophihabitantaceae bacterium]
MGWHNPDVTWRELERRLSGRPIEDRGPVSRKRVPPPAPSTRRRVKAPRYAELHAHSSFSHLDGASTPEELAAAAAELGLSALAITDHDGMYGAPRFAAAAAQQQPPLPTIFGAELSCDLLPPVTTTGRLVGARSAMPDPPGRHLLVLARDPTGYASLCRGISRAQLRGGAKGHPVYDWDEFADLADGHWLVLTGCRKGPVRQALDVGQYGTFALDPARRALAELVDRFGRDNVAVELTYAREPLADERYDVLAQLAGEAGLPIVATTGAHYHTPARRRLATALAAVRARCSLDELDGWLPAWADARLRSGAELAERFARWPGAVEHAARLGDELAFDLRLVAPNLPPFPVPGGFADEMAYLRHLTYAGAAERYGTPLDEKVRARLEHELAVIADRDFPGYFLVVWDITKFCRDNGILCQGRGSAAGSAVCYALEVTAIDPVGFDLLFERFLAPDRTEAPDIDIDIESGQPREDVIQYVYRKHGREYAAQVANAITYRPKIAVRDIARALGYSPGQQDAWSKQIEQGYWTDDAAPSTGCPDGDIPPLVRELATELTVTGQPRHLGIHSGGMVICDRPIIDVCPVEWARMPDRSVLQWDKDDCEYAGLVKFDLLGLGMLSALRQCFELIESWHGEHYELATIPKEQPCVYEILGRADTVGVFQVESRAQMQALPRLRPKKFYELAIQVAMIRPGPIQGGAVHPYIRRKNSQEDITYPHPLLKPALERTLGVPLFQEQLMEIAVHGAGFSPAEADQLRRAMGSKRGVERIDAMEARLYDGLADHGITDAVAGDIVNRVKAFASFGFAESHALSFALLVYASAWLKRHYPAAFLAALLNSQPMGFYSPQTLVHDAKRHGIEVHRPDVNRSATRAALETGTGSRQCACEHGNVIQPAVRLGLSGVRTVDTEVADRIVAEREARGPFTSITDLARRAGVSGGQLEALATAGAFDGLGLQRRTALWIAGGAADTGPDQLALCADPDVPTLTPMTEPEQLIADMWATSITPDRYPTALIRGRLDALGVTVAARLREIPDRTRVTVGGVVTHRQRPSTAGGVTFLNLEDETGMVNVICPSAVWDRHRRIARDSGGLLIRGRLERAGDIANVLAERIAKLPLGLRTRSRDFR